MTPDRPTVLLRAKQRERTNLAKELFLDTSFLTKGAKEDLPQSYDKAIKGPEANQWKEAMDVEMSQLNEMGTWKKEDLPEEQKAICCRWVLARKKDKHRKIVKYKACLVAQEFSQRPGTNYLDNSTFALVMRFKTLRTMLANSNNLM